MFQNWP